MFYVMEHFFRSHTVLVATKMHLLTRIADPNQTILYGISDVRQHYLPSKFDSFCLLSSNPCDTYRRTILVRLQFCPHYSVIYSVKG